MNIDFNREYYLTEHQLNARKIIFLDFNFWLGLLWGKSHLFKALCKIIADGVDQNRLVIPISLANFWELLKQKDKSQLHECSLLMDKLSKRIVFRDYHRAILDELVFLYQNDRKGLSFQDFPVEIGFTLLPEILGDAALSWREPESAREIHRQMAKMIFNKLIDQDVYYFASILDKEERKIRVMKRHSDYERNMKQTLSMLDRDSFSFEEQINREIDAIMEGCGSRIDAKMKRVDPSVKIKFLSRHDFQTLRRYYFEKCPTLHSAALIFAAYVEHAKTYRQNDFYDVENLSSVCPYSDIVAIDKHMRHIASNRLKLDIKLNTIIVSTPADLLDSLEKILPTE
jgi:hypothetical protein